MKAEATFSAARWWLTQPVHKPVSAPVPSGTLLTVEEAAARLGVSTKWIYRHYKTLPYVLIPAGKKPRIRFRQRDLDIWILRHRFDWRKP